MDLYRQDQCLSRSSISNVFKGVAGLRQWYAEPNRQIGNSFFDELLQVGQRMFVRAKGSPRVVFSSSK